LSCGNEELKISRGDWTPLELFLAGVRGWEVEDQDQREAQTKQKKEFDDLIKKLEGKKINGVEFECKGEWLTKGYKLRVTTVPQPTEAGKKRIRDGGK